MATIKVTDLSETLKKRLNGASDAAKGKWQDKACKALLDAINSLLDEGKSPVQNAKPRFDKYSKSYAEQRKKKGLSTSPVQMRATGELRDSLRVTPIGKSAIQIYFSGGRNSELAIIHSLFGASKKKVIRTLLPYGSQVFIKNIRDELISLFKSIFKL
jgi:hypothetical protein